MKTVTFNKKKSSYVFKHTFNYILLFVSFIRDSEYFKTLNKRYKLSSSKKLK